MTNKILTLFAIMVLISNAYTQNFETIMISQNSIAPIQVEVIDFDLDTLDDIIVMGQQELVLYENIGNAQFTKHIILDSLSQLRNFFLFDWDGDGDYDIFVTAFSATVNKSFWLENLGNMNFAHHLIDQTIPEPSYIKAIDLDRDNDNDILISSKSTQELYWLVNDGLGNFSIDTIGGSVNNFEIADLNGDNDWDIIFGKAYVSLQTWTDVRAFQNDGSNNFSTIILKTGFGIIHEIIIDDIDEDGFFDIIVPDYNSNNIRWLKNNGSYDFSTSVTIVTNFNGVTGVAVKDVNQDGKKDIIAGAFTTQQIRYFEGQGVNSTTSFSSGTTVVTGLNSITDLAIGNFDGQNNLDFVHLDRGLDLVSVWLNNGSQTFTQNILAESFDSPRYFDMGDLNGDGLNDFAAVSNGNNIVAWFENLGNNLFKQHKLHTNYTAPYQILIEDLNGDGHLDIICGSNGLNRVDWWENDGNGNFIQQTITTNHRMVRNFVVKDFNLDGHLDVAVQGYSTSTTTGNKGVYIYYNNGSQSFSSQLIDNTRLGGRTIRAADMNNNNRVDLVYSHYFFGDDLMIGVNTPSGFYTTKIDDISCEEFELCDFNQDGLMDILVVDFNTDTLYFYQNLGNLQFSRQAIAHFEDLYNISPVDFDGDGDLDIIFSTGKNAFTNSLVYEFGIFRNDGFGNLNTEVWVQNLSIIKANEVFDYDNDGDYDIVIGFDYQDKIVLYKNNEIDCPLMVTAVVLGDPTLCEGDAIQINAISLDQNINYQWYKNSTLLTTDTLPYLLVSESGIYSVKISDTTCSKMSNPISINVIPDFFLIENHAICTGETYLWHGTNYTATGTYTATYSTAQGCDSVYTLNLTVNPEYTFIENYTICNGETYLWHGTNYTTTGTYTATYTTAQGCDSVYTLHLTVNPEYTFIENHAICNGETYLWHGTNYTTTGTYTATYPTAQGCDSVYTLNLTVNPEYTFTENHAICNGETYLWHGTNYTATGTYTATYSSAQGCDSVYTLNLTVNPEYTFIENHSICNGETYLWHGTNYTATGTYTATYPTALGCDSVYTLNLTVNPEYTFIENHAICTGETYLWHGTNYTTTGTYTATYPTAQGCDSVYTLNLTVNPEYTFIENHAICTGETYLWHGTNYTATGTYTATYSTAQGCDSVYTLNLTVNPEYTFIENHAICTGETYLWHGTNYTATGTYTATYSTAQGCDSVYTLNLTVNPEYTFIENHAICTGETYLWHGTNYTTTGTYTATYSTAQGCDSVYTLNLTVNFLPSVFIGNDTLIYDNETLLLDAGSEFANYLWHDGSTTQTYLVDGNLLGIGVFNFSVEVTDFNSCKNRDTITVEIEEHNGVEEHPKIHIKLYPNPANEQVFVELKNIESYSIELYSSEGKMIKNCQFEYQDLNTLKIDIRQYPSGIYHLRFKNRSNIVTKSFIITR